MIVKDIWLDKDFEEMGWHDCRIYSISFPDEEFRFSLNIDYIFKWEKVKEELKGFWVSPCVLKFESVSDFNMSIQSDQSLMLFISNITRKNKRKTPNTHLIEWDYEIECDKGNICFSATGFEQRVKREPMFSITQDLGQFIG